MVPHITVQEADLEPLVVKHDNTKGIPMCVLSLSARLLITYQA